jgi:uncharacterized transporter YbjL
MALDQRRTEMASKRHKPEEVVAKLRQVDVLVSQGQAVEQRDRAIAAVVEALRELLRRIGETTDDAQRGRLQEAVERLILKNDELVALRLRDILDSTQVKSALARLRRITSDLAEEAKAMKATADALAAAARIIGWATPTLPGDP